MHGAKCKGKCKGRPGSSVHTAPARTYLALLSPKSQPPRPWLSLRIADMIHALSLAILLQLRYCAAISLPKA